MRMSESVKSNVLGANPQIGEHRRAGIDHHWWAAKVELDGFRMRMRLQILAIDDVMHEAGGTVPAVFGQGC